MGPWLSLAEDPIAYDAEGGVEGLQMQDSEAEMLLVRRTNARFENLTLEGKRG